MKLRALTKEEEVEFAGSGVHPLIGELEVFGKPAKLLLAERSGLLIRQDGAWLTKLEARKALEVIAGLVPDKVEHPVTLSRLGFSVADLPRSDGPERRYTVGLAGKFGLCGLWLDGQPLPGVTAMSVVVGENGVRLILDIHGLEVNFT